MRSDFAVVGDNSTNENKDIKEVQNAQAGEDEEDHQKFFKKMQECFSSTKKNSRKKSNGLDYVDNDERDNKSAAFQL